MTIKKINNLTKPRITDNIPKFSFEKEIVELIKLEKQKESKIEYPQLSNSIFYIINLRICNNHYFYETQFEHHNNLLLNYLKIFLFDEEINVRFHTLE